MHKVIQDIYRFYLKHRTGIEFAPLQVYSSALIFSPTSSIVRQTYEEAEGAEWIITKPDMPLGWNACLQIIEGHHNRIGALAISPDGTRVASAADTETIVWELETGVALHTFDRSFAPIAIAFSPHGLYLAIGNHHDIKIYDLTTSTCRYTLKAIYPNISSLSFSPDSSRLSAGCNNGSVRTWELNKPTGTELGRHDFATDNPVGTLFALDGTHIAWVLDNNRIHIQNLTTNRRLPTLDVNCRRLESVAFSADAARLALTTYDKEAYERAILIFDPLTGKHLQIIDGPLVGGFEKLAFLADCTRLISGSSKGVIIWDSVTGACLRHLKVPTHKKLLPSPDGTFVAIPSSKKIEIWDTVIDQPPPVRVPYDDGLSAIAFSLDGTQFATATSFNIKVWDSATGECLKQIGCPGCWIRSVKFFPDGKRLAVAGRHGIEIWDVLSPVRLQVIERGHTGTISMMAISSDSNLMAIAVFSNRPPMAVDYLEVRFIEIWDVTTTGSPKQRLEDVSIRAEAMAFSSDNTRLGSISQDGSVEIYDVHTGARLRNLWGFFESLYDGVFFVTQSQADTYISDLKSLINGQLEEEDVIKGLKPSGLSITSDISWIIRGGKPLLWLPSDDRPDAIAIYDGLILLGYRSDKILFIRLDIDTLDKQLT